MQTQRAPAATEKTKAGLVRAMGGWDLVALAINGMIGAGIFGFPSQVFKTIGVYSLGAFVVCGIFIAMIVYCFAEVGSRFDGTGGPYLYAHEAFRPVVGFEVGWLIWLARLTAFAANLNLLVDYVGYFWVGLASPTGRPALIIALTTALTIVNIVGVKDAALASNIFTIGKLAPLACFVLVVLFFVRFDNFTPGLVPPIGDVSKAVLLLVYAFTGFEMAVIPAGEIKDPRRSLPLAILRALAVVTVTYVLIQVVCIGTFPELGSSSRPLADASARFMGRGGAGFITAGAVISVIGTLNVLVLAESRLPFAMSERGELPQILAATHAKFRTPYVSILVTAVVMTVLTLTGTFIYAATISIIARLLAYAATCAALLVFRSRKTAPQALFNAPGAAVVAVLSLLLICWLLANCKGTDARDAAIAAGTGLVVYGLFRLRRTS